MAQCIVINASGQLEATAADPCTSLVALTPAEYSALATNPLNLSVEDGTTVAGAIAAVWIGAWCWRALLKTLRSDGEALDD